MSINDVIKLNLNELQTWVYSNLTRELQSVNDFNWVGLAEVLALDARNNSNLTEKIKLAELAITIYEQLAESHIYDYPDSLLNSAIALRVYLISNNYVNPFHPLLGENELSNLVLKQFNFSCSDTLKLSKKYSKKIKNKDNRFSPSELGDMKELRKIKNMINLLKNMPSDSKLVKELETSGWLEVSKKIP